MKIALFCIMTICFIVVLATFSKVYLNPKSALEEIHRKYEDWDFRNALSVPDELKDDCIEWAYGKDWKTLQWNLRGEKFRDLHPELDANDFSDATPIILDENGSVCATFDERVSMAYLNIWKTK